MAIAITLRLASDSTSVILGKSISLSVSLSVELQVVFRVRPLACGCLMFEDINEGREIRLRVRRRSETLRRLPGLE